MVKLKDIIAPIVLATALSSPILADGNGPYQGTKFDDSAHTARQQKEKQEKSYYLTGGIMFGIALGFAVGTVAGYTIGTRYKNR